MARAPERGGVAVNVDVIGGRSGIALTLALRAGDALDLTPARLEAVKAESVTALTEAQVASGGEIEAGADGCFAVAFDASWVVGLPTVVPVPETPAAGSFLPFFAEGQILTAPLSAVLEPSRRVTALFQRGPEGKLGLRALYPGDPVERLGEPGYALALAEDDPGVAAVIEDLALNVARGVNALNELARLAGFEADILELGARQVSFGARGFTMSFQSRSGKAPVQVEVARNAIIFSARRRFDPRLHKIGFSDAEILRTGIASIELNRPAQEIDVTFMRRDARQAHMVVSAAHPLDPVVDPTIPVEALGAIGESRFSLSGLGRTVAAALKSDSPLRSALFRLWSPEAKQAHEDALTIQGFSGAPLGLAQEGVEWSERPARIAQLAEAVLRHSPLHQDDGTSPLRSALFAVALGRLLGPSRPA